MVLVTGIQALFVYLYSMSLFIRSICFLTLVVISYSCTAQVKDSLNRTDKKGFKQGHWIKKGPDGKVIYDGSFLNDKPVGKFTYYYPTGKVKSITTFYPGDKAFTQLFGPEGKKVMQGKVSAELKDSTWTYYGESDSLTSLENYSKGKKHGVFKTFFPNGKVLELATYKNDILDGPYKQYFDNGTLRMEYSFVNGLRDGKAKFYFPSGQLNIEGAYVKDFKEGTWNYYGETGSMDVQAVYKKSNMLKSKRFNGIEEELYPSRIPKSRVTYKGGAKNGVFTEYYDEGQIKQEAQPAKDGYPQETKEVVEGQKVKRKGAYTNDKLEGTVTYYKLDGTIEKEETYKNGELIK